MRCSRWWRQIMGSQHRLLVWHRKGSEKPSLQFCFFIELKKAGMPLFLGGHRAKNSDKHQNLALGIIKSLNFRSKNATSIKAKKKKQVYLKQLHSTRSSSGRVCRLQGRGCDRTSWHSFTVTDDFVDCWIFTFKMRGERDNRLGLSWLTERSHKNLCSKTWSW